MKRTGIAAGLGWLLLTVCNGANATSAEAPAAETGAARPTAAGDSAEFGTIPGHVVEPGGGEILAPGPASLRYLIRAAHGAGLSMLEYSVAGRFDAPPTPHWHTREHFIAYVLEGELLFRLAQGERRLGPGAVLHLPPGAPFAWSNPHDAPARFLCIWSPGGFESFFAEVVASLRERDLTGPAPPEIVQQVIAPLWRKYGIETPAR